MTQRKDRDLKSNRKSATSRRQRTKRLLIQPLEARNLLAAEGLGTDISQTFTTTGIVGSLSSTINWGDGTQSAGTVSGTTDNNGPLSIKFEYRGSFFNDPARRAILEDAAASVIERFSDDLEAIVPTSFLQWTAVTNDPLNSSNQLRIPNLQVAANQLVVYVGAQDFPDDNDGDGVVDGHQLGESFPGFAETSFPGLYTPEQIAQIQAFQETLQYRGETGAAGPNPTDIGMWGGYISFDSDTNWHFGATTEGLDDEEIDFATVAIHELMHLLGFGVNYAGAVNSSFETMTNGLSFIGPKARALYGGDVPLEDNGHFHEDVQSNGQQSVVSARVERGTRKLVTPLDIAALDDIGWTVRPAPSATVTATHIYADNPAAGSTYPVEVILRGSEFGEMTQSITTSVTNTAPTLSVPTNQSVEINRAFTITNIGELSDPGFTNAAAGTSETFTYTIDWGDGNSDTGDATIDRNGNGTLTTQASFDRSHTYTAVGTYTVRVTARDDDGGTDTETFTITVTPQPEFSLTVSQGSIAEDAGNGAATLTVTRSGPALPTDQTVTLRSDDEEEATTQATVVIPANQTSATAPINAVDDTRLDGTQTVTFTASATGVVPGETTIDVLDAEFLTAEFVGGNITEGESTPVVLRITRSNTDVDSELTVNISGGNSGQLTFDNPATIPGGQQSVSITLVPVQDDQPELTKTLDYVISSGTYASANATVDILDDEPPEFQNQGNRFDADGVGGLTPADILTVIDQLAEEGNDVLLDPEVRANIGLFYDVDGNYLLTPNDILEVINELARLAAPSNQDPPGGELIAGLDSNVSSSFIASADDNDEDDEAHLVALLDQAFQAGI